MHADATSSAYSASPPPAGAPAAASGTACEPISNSSHTGSQITWNGAIGVAGRYDIHLITGSKVAASCPLIPGWQADEHAAIMCMPHTLRTLLGSQLTTAFSACPL